MDLNILMLAMGSPFRQPSGVLRVWGDNTYNQLGLGDAANNQYSLPQQLGFASNWVEVATSSRVSGPRSSAAILDTGVLFAWGANDVGQLGLGFVNNPNGTTFFSTPQQVGTESWSKISGGDGFFIAIRSDGTLWSWGENTYGQLGLGDTTNRTSPTQVGAASNWVAVKAADFGASVFGIRSDGTLWSWGRNNIGQLGLGNTTNQSSPVQVGTDTNWAKVSCGGSSHALAVKTTGTLWSCGFNNLGQLGLGNTTNYNTFQQVGTDTNWTNVSASTHASSGSSFAIKTNGTIWSWGRNFFGALGNGSFDDDVYSTPQQIGTDTNWDGIFTGGISGFAVKTNGTLFAWGLNSRGQLGLGDTANRASPVQVGVLSSWAKVAPGYEFALGITYP